jgi:hypothetical protein
MKYYTGLDVSLKTTFVSMYKFTIDETKETIDS